MMTFVLNCLFCSLPQLHTALVTAFVDSPILLRFSFSVCYLSPVSYPPDWLWFILLLLAGGLSWPGCFGPVACGIRKVNLNFTFPASA